MPACELSVAGQDARVVMRCDAKGIAVRVERRAEATGQAGDLLARDAADLKARYPDAWAFYDWATRGMGGDDGTAMRKWFEQFLVSGKQRPHVARVVEGEGGDLDYRCACLLAELVGVRLDD